MYFVCQPAVRPGCARCRAPEISHNKGNGGEFTKTLFRRRFTHCAMAIPFILHSFPCSSLFLSKVRISPKVTIACNGFCLLRHTKTWLARDIISYNGTMFSRVLYCIVNFEIIALDKWLLLFFERYLLSHSCFAM